MKKINRWFKEFFKPEVFNDLDMELVASSFNDQQVRSVWLANVLEEIKRINLEVERRLLSGNEICLTDLCARRKAFQDVLEMTLSARRIVVGVQRPNPRPEILVNLDRVTA